MAESIHSASLYLLVFAFAVYAVRWRSAAQREMRAHQAIETKITTLLEASRRRVQKRRLDARDREHERANS